MPHLAFQITEEDIENVLCTHRSRLAAGADALLPNLAEGTNPGYCDACPVDAICPNPGKAWSK